MLKIRRELSPDIVNNPENMISFAGSTQSMSGSVLTNLFFRNYESRVATFLFISADLI